jgi:hypothetical protein
VVEDRGPNGYDGTPVVDLAATQGGGLTQDYMPWGEPALRNNKGANGYLNFGTATNLVFSGTDTVFGLAMWVLVKNTGGQMLFSRAGNYFLQLPGTGQIQLSLPGALYNPGIFKYMHENAQLIGFFVDEGNYYVSLNGVTLGSAARSGTIGGGTLRIGQYLASNFDMDGLFTPPIFYKAFTNLAEYEAEVQAEYARVAAKPIINNTLSDAYIHANAITGGPIPGTEYVVKSGGFKVSTDTVDAVAHTKVLECTTAGVASFRIDKEASGAGTWTFWVNKADASSTNIRFISSSENFASSNGYQIQIDTDEAVDIERVTSGTPTAVMTSAAGVVTAGQWHKITVKRYAGVVDPSDEYGNCAVYVDDTLVTAATGSNPVADKTYVSGTHILFDMDAGDKVLFKNQLFGS